MQVSIPNEPARGRSADSPPGPGALYRLHELHPELAPNFPGIRRLKTTQRDTW
jgi:hypothetical protein